jgi:hypothetical protein
MRRLTSVRDAGTEKKLLAVPRLSGYFHLHSLYGSFYVSKDVERRTQLPDLQLQELSSPSHSADIGY